MQDKNPYTGIIEIIRKHGADNNTPGIILGVITSALPNIKIRIEQIEIDKDNLLIADYLLNDYTRECTITGSVTFSDNNVQTTKTANVGDHGTHSHEINKLQISTNDVNIQGSSVMVSPLVEGDIVACIPTADMQIYIVLAKVVSLA